MPNPAVGQRGAKLAQRIPGEFGFQHDFDSFAHAFAGFQHDVANEPVGHDDIHMVLEQVMSLHVTKEIQVQLTAEFGGVARQVISLKFFFAVAENANARAGMAENFAGINAAHDSELGEMQRLAFGGLAMRDGQDT